MRIHSPLFSENTIIMASGRISPCEVCGSTETIKDNEGFKCCQQCGCRKEEEQLVTDEIHKFRLLVQTTKKRKTRVDWKTVITSEDKTYPGGPGSFIECFQIVLQRQTKALIEMGLDKKLDQIIQSLWERFVQRTLRKFVPRHQRGRGTLSRLKLSTKNNFKMLDAPQDATQKQKNKANEPLDMSWMNDDYVEPVEDDKTKEAEWENELVEDFDYPKPNDLLSILYIGCVVLNQPILIPDLLRFVKTDQIPAVGDVCKKFGFESDFSRQFPRSRITFVPHILWSNTIAVVKLIDLVKPLQISIKDHLARFILQLQLKPPEKFYSMSISFVNTLRDSKIIPQDWFSLIDGQVTVGCKVMSLIVVIIKMNYRMDGTPTEADWLEQMKKKVSEKDLTQEYIIDDRPPQPATKEEVLSLDQEGIQDYLSNAITILESVQSRKRGTSSKLIEPTKEEQEQWEERQQEVKKIGIQKKEEWRRKKKKQEAERRRLTQSKWEPSEDDLQQTADFYFVEGAITAKEVGFERYEFLLNLCASLLEEGVGDLRRLVHWLDVRLLGSKFES